MPRAPVAIRPAATVMLLRDTASGPQTWMMRRVRAMSFAPNMSVFPGGGVDPSDAELAGRWEHTTLHEELRRVLDCPSEDVRMLVNAAVREVFEETGVLLAHPSPGRPLGDLRLAVESGAVPFRAALAQLGCEVDPSLLRPWARWITPEAESRRYDTWFFAAELPAGGLAEIGSTEAEIAEWITPADALAEWQAGDRPMLPPTIAMLRTLLPHDSVAAILASAPVDPLPVIRPQLRLRPDGSREIQAFGQSFVIPSRDPS